MDIDKEIVERVMQHSVSQLTRPSDATNILINIGVWEIVAEKKGEKLRTYEVDGVEVPVDQYRRLLSERLSYLTATSTPLNFVRLGLIALIIGLSTCNSTYPTNTLESRVENQSSEVQYLQNPTY